MLTATAGDAFAMLIVAALCLLIVRCLDLNEREPLWALVLAFVLGGAAAGALHLGISTVALNLGPWPGTGLRGGALFAAVAVTFLIFREIGSLRGWSEVTDVLDGVIYGLAVGLGFACGEIVATLDLRADAVRLPSNPTWSLLPVVTGALPLGVFGALVGGGVGLGSARTGPLRYVAPIVGLGLAMALYAAHFELAHGNALGDDAVLRARLAWLLPMIGVLALAVYGFAGERRTIATRLADEPEAVTPSELALLQRPLQRQLRYLAALLTARLREFRTLPALHNRQVMLALAKQRAARAPDERLRQAALAEAEALRRSIAALRLRLAATPTTGAAS